MVFIGTLGYNVNTKEPYIENIWMMAKDSVDLITKLDKGTSLMIVGGILSLMASSFIGHYIYTIAKEFYNRKGLIKKQEAIKERMIKNSLALHQELTEDQKESLMCMVCNEYVRDVLVLPCHHLLTCSDCYYRLQNAQTCMVCKKPVEGIAHIFPE